MFLQGLLRQHKRDPARNVLVRILSRIVQEPNRIRPVSCKGFLAYILKVSCKDIYRNLQWSSKMFTRLFLDILKQSLMHVYSQGMKFEGIPMRHHGYPLWQYSHLCTSHTDPRVLVIFYFIRQAKVAGPPNFYSSFQPMSKVREWSLRAFRCVTMDTHYGSTAIYVQHSRTPECL